jgi:hypothetical protein
MSPIEPLTAGVSIAEAARAAGVHRNTVTNWRREIPALQERALLIREETKAFHCAKSLHNCTNLHNGFASSRGAVPLDRGRRPRRPARKNPNPAQNCTTARCRLTAFTEPRA